MTTQIADRGVKTLLTEEDSFNNQAYFVPSQYIPVGQRLITSPQMNLYNLYNRIRAIGEVDYAGELLRFLAFLVDGENTGQTGTIFSEGQNQQSEYSETKSELFLIEETAEESPLEETLEHNVVIRFPPPKKYTIQLRVKSVAKGKPRIVEPEGLL